MPTFNALDVDVLPPDAKPPEGFKSSPDNSIRDALEGAFEADSGSPGGTPAPSKEGGVGVTPVAAPESTPGGRPRAANGKFAKGGVPTEEIPKFTDPAAAPKTPAEATPIAAEGGDTFGKAPASWKPEKAALWDKIADPEARTYIHEREKQLQDGFQRAAQVREVAEGVLSEFIPYQEILQQENASPASAIRALLQTAYALRTAEPEYRKALFLQLAHQYGVDFSQGINPDIARAQAETAGLRHQQMERAARGTHDDGQRVADEIGKFAETHEFFPQVRETMGKLLQSGVSPDLETAYQQALKLVPEVGAEVERRGVAAAQAAKLDADRQRAAHATRGGSAPGAGRMGSGGAPPPASSIRDSLEAAWAANERG